MRIAASFLAAATLACMGLASCVGTPPLDKVAAEVRAAGACDALPASATCDCVINTAHAQIPNIKVERSKDDTGSRLGRGAVGQADERIPAAIASAKQICASGKAIG